MKTIDISLPESVVGAVLAAVMEQYVVLEFRSQNMGGVSQVFKDQIQQQKSLLKAGSDAIMQGLDSDNKKRIIRLN